MEYLVAYVLIALGVVGMAVQMAYQHDKFGVQEWEPIPLFVAASIMGALWPVMLPVLMRNGYVKTQEFIKYGEIDWRA